MLRSARAPRWPLPIGITAKSINPEKNNTTGASQCTSLSPLAGIMSSLINVLMASAIGCSSPNGPQRLGPGRSCIQAMNRLSSQMNMITMGNTNMSIRIMPIRLSSNIISELARLKPCSHSIQSVRTFTNRSTMYSQTLIIYQPRPRRYPRCQIL